jgi:hypothetical protein
MTAYIEELIHAIETLMDKAMERESKIEAALANR